MGIWGVRMAGRGVPLVIPVFLDVHYHISVVVSIMMKEQYTFRFLPTMIQVKSIDMFEWLFEESYQNSIGELLGSCHSRLFLDIYVPVQSTHVRERDGFNRMHLLRPLCFE